MTPEEQIENLNQLCSFLTSEERLLLQRPWLNPPYRITSDLKAARELVQEMINSNVPIICTDQGFTVKAKK